MRERTRLGLWICLPLLAWGVVWTAVLSMPASDCDGTDVGEGETLLIALVAAASLATAVAALWRFVGLALGNAFSAGRDLTLVGSVVASGLVAVAATSRVEAIFVTGLILTGLALLSLLVAYPLVGLLGLLVSSGIGC